MDFILIIGRRGVLPLCQCAASLPRLFDDEMHLNHSPMMGPILAARFLLSQTLL